MKKYQALSPAKVNLGLRIIGKRPEDGYHLLESCFYPVPALADEIALMEAPAFRLAESGIVIGGAMESNLMYKAWKALKTIVPELPPVEIHIRKSIPAGAGLGGGSSNAATTAMLLNEAFSLGLSTSRLAGILAPLGADVPFFVYQTPMLATGIGHDLTPVSVNLDGYEIRIYTQPVHSATVEVYRELRPEDYSTGPSLASILQLPPSAWRDALINDLERPVFRIHPGLARVKEQIYGEGAAYAAMSGSGSAFFGIFPV